MYELGVIQTFPMENYNSLAQYLANCFISNQALEFYFINTLLNKILK